MRALQLTFLTYRGLSNAQSEPTVCDTPEEGFQCRPSLSHTWGQYSPFFSVPSEIDAAVPQGCEITFAQILSRHGARDPTSGKTTIYNDTVTRIHESVTEYGPGFEFIKDYEYTLGADQLTTLGGDQLFNSGIKFYSRYQALSRKSVPFIRSSGQDRVIESAVHWTEGFHQSRVVDDASDALPYDMLLIPETEGSNNTLDHGLCTSFEDGQFSELGDDAQDAWLKVFAPPITAKLNKNLPGANFSDQDTIYVMDLCPFNTVASANGTISPFCDLFTQEEWEDYSYYQSVGKWYGYSLGNPLGPTQGVGYVNELIARLTGKPVEDRTSTNSTLDGSPDTFPLDRALYADFSHDNDMTAVYAALGLYNATENLSTEKRQTTDETKGYSAAWTAPFAARMYVEKMTCGGGGEELVRVLVNDRVVPLQGCGADELGRCCLGKFVESLTFAQAGGHWDQCFA